MRPRTPAMLGVLTLLSLFGSGLSADAPLSITQKNLVFSQPNLSINKGQVVVFVNDDRTNHNITVSGVDNPVRVNGGLQPPGAEFRMPFSVPGTYQVTCGIHPRMKMTVIVK